jgi:hypothetical protein
MSLGPSLPLAPCYHPRAGINKGQTSLPSGAHNKGSAWSCTASPHGPVWTRSLASPRCPNWTNAGEKPEYHTDIAVANGYCFLSSICSARIKACAAMVCRSFLSHTTAMFFEL